MNNNLVLIERKDGISIYGKVGSNSRLGKFEVHTGKAVKEQSEYALLSDAEGKMNSIIFARKQEEARRKEEGIKNKLDERKTTKVSNR